MKPKILFGALCAALTVCASPGALAQSDQPPTDGPAGHHGRPHGKKGGPGGPMPGLPPEEAQRLAAARDKAKDDPTVRSLREARDAVNDQLEQAMSSAMLAADPSLAPILEKLQQARTRAKDMRNRFESLTPEQKEQLKAARQKAKDDPAVVAAREKMMAAGSPEARREAVKAMHEAMKAAALKQNPGLAPLLEKLGPPPGPPEGPMGGHDGPHGPPPGFGEE